MRLYEEVPYVPFLAELQARQIALSNQLAAGAGEGEGDPCVRHILVETEDEADEILVELAADGDFATLAAERSTGPTGPNGGDLGCAPSAGYVPEFAEAIDAAELGEYVGPIQTEFGWHVLIVDSYQVDGDTLANEAIRAGLSSVTVEVDERIGEWSTEQLIVVPVGS
jgi:peptidyl-prolyl cis-trans isomerase C